jgi:hypothetical protein
MPCTLQQLVFCVLLLLLFFYFHNNPPVGQGLLIHEVHECELNDEPQSVGLLWTSDQLVARDLYLTTHNTHNRQTYTPPLVFEPTFSVGQGPQNSALDRAATGTGCYSS